ncbi:MAG: DUF3520 domain-containing protein [Chitinivibrionales bacterium]|nr:DUF3520 domain-containing protein [Chitinivibrionales bacterium]
MRFITSCIVAAISAIGVALFIGCSPRALAGKEQPEPATPAKITEKPSAQPETQVSPTTSPSIAEEKLRLRPRARYDRTKDEAPAMLQNAAPARIGIARKPRMRQAPGCGYAGRTASPRCAERAPHFNTESYDHITENRFHRALDKPLSTFSIDVDAASYSNIRRFISRNSLPPADAVRIEEMINYFSYAYRQPHSNEPFSINTELGSCPWNQAHRLVHIGLQGKKVETRNLPPSNLVFLLDVSGSMNSTGKLPLLKSAMKLLVKNLRPADQIAIVVYAGAAGLVLPSTCGDNKEAIIEALDNLQAGGSTAGGAGINLAYTVAQENFLQQGNNRIILATDGDFNVGASSDGEMVRLIEAKRKAGVFLTVLGFGTGNYKDSKMEKLADKGNGNYAYIDNILEAKKVLVNEIGATLLTIAKDVKIQVEFNPSKVQAYRLIGYENRQLRAEDFNDDTKDAGELGAGHTVTALFEIIPAGVTTELVKVDPLKYQRQPLRSPANSSSELLTVKFRYKNPSAAKSRLIVHALEAAGAGSYSENFAFSAAVAGFGMLLRDSAHKNDLTYDKVLTLARQGAGRDAHGYRAEFIRLVERAQLLAGSKRS